MEQNRKDPKSLLREGAMRLGLRLDDQQVAQFLVYLEQLKRWSRTKKKALIAGDATKLKQLSKRRS